MTGHEVPRWALRALRAWEENMGTAEPSPEDWAELVADAGRTCVVRGRYTDCAFVVAMGNGTCAGLMTVEHYPRQPQSRTVIAMDDDHITGGIR